MWISRAKLKARIKEMIDKAYDDGLDKGYRLGFIMGVIEARNRLLSQPKSLVDLQIEQILNNKENK